MCYTRLAENTGCKKWPRVIDGGRCLTGEQWNCCCVSVCLWWCNRSGLTCCHASLVGRSRANSVIISFDDTRDSRWDWLSLQLILVHQKNLLESLCKRLTPLPSGVGGSGKDAICHFPCLAVCALTLFVWLQVSKYCCFVGQPGITLEETDRQTPFKSLFSRITWVMGTRKVKPIWILMKQEMTGWQWHQLDHIQITCTSCQADNHASTSSLKLFTGWTLQQCCLEACCV